jgi:hypothetical protein
MNKYFNVMKNLKKIIVASFLFLLLSNCGQEDYKRILEVGITGKAVINKVEDTNVTVNGNPQVRLFVTIYSNGKEAYDANFKVVVSRVSIPRTSDVIIVKYDPVDNQKVIWIEEGDITPEMQNEFDNIGI